MTEGFSEAFFAIVERADAKGIERVNELPGCWEDSAGEWWFAVNGHPGETIECSRGIEVESFHAYIEYNGWPAGVITPGGGVIAAGEAANEDAFIRALRTV